MNEESIHSPPQAPQVPEVAPIGDERTWGLLGHLSALSAFVIGIGGILGPLVIWLIKRDTLPFAGDQAKEALNFNITVALVAIGLIVLTFITFGIGALLTVPLGLALFVAWLVLTIIAAINANNGVRYRYPLTLRLVQ